VRRPPRPLAALLLLTALVGVAWSLVTPAFQAPDENAHWAYLQTLAENFSLPGDVKRQKFSTEQNLADSASNAEQAAAQVYVPMEWSAGAYDRWRAQEARMPRAGHADGGGPNPAASNPPLYYLYEVPAYRIGESGDLFTRLQLVRLASVLWLLVTVSAVWALAGEALGRDRLLQTVAAGTAGLAPMMGFVSGSLNPDAMLYAVWSVALWLGVRLIKRGLTPARAGALFAVVGIGVVVKATSLALVPPALLAFGIAAWRRLRRDRDVPRPRRQVVIAGGAAAAGLVLTEGVWVAVSHGLHRSAAAQVSQVSTTATLNIRELGSYLWQFYLPRLPFQTPFRATDVIPVYDVWLKTSWASFGWLEVNFPGWVYVVLTGVTVLVALLAASALWRRRRGLDRATFAFLALVVVVLLAGLHWTEYWWMTENRGPFTTGRYLLPLIGVAGLVVAVAVRRLPRTWRPVAVALALSGLIVLDLFSFGLMMERFYA
jgi:4-amino-4-deoxy-L-arabinose transferase-like glycosyltransferase